LATGGRYPKTSSMYRMALRLVVPDWVRIQPTSWFRSRDTKNIRSASLIWAMENIETLGFPLAS